MKNYIKNKIRSGFTPLELLMVIGISAVVAGLFVLTENQPTQQASVPPINVNVEQPQVTVNPPDVNVNVEPAQLTMSPPDVNVNVAQPNRQPAAMASGECDETVDGSEGISALQAAVDLGGTVCLTGTFDFGLGGVTITENTEIVGMPGATILDGRIVFTVDAPGKTVVIKGITFEGISSSNILVKKSGNLTIEENVMGEALRAILVGRWWPWPYYTEGDITGSLIIRNNIFGLNSAISYGIFIGFTDTDDLRIEGNTMRNILTRGILVLNTKKGILNVERNDIRPGAVGKDNYGAGEYTDASAIVILNGFVGVPSSTNMSVVKNTVEVENPNAFGILIGSTGYNGVYPDVLVSGNHVMRNPDPSIPIHRDEDGNYLDPFWGIKAGINISQSNVLVHANKVEGNGRYAIASAGIFGLNNDDNSFIGNNVSNFAAEEEDYLLLNAENNLIVGEHSSVQIDGGSGNKVVGNLTQEDRGVGQDVKDAIQAWTPRPEAYEDNL